MLRLKEEQVLVKFLSVNYLIITVYFLVFGECGFSRSRPETIDDYRTPKHKPQEVGSRTRLESRIGSDVCSLFTAGQFFFFFFNGV